VIPSLGQEGDSADRIPAIRLIAVSYDLAP